MLGWCVREGETLPLSQYVFLSGPGRGKGNEGKQLGIFFLSFLFLFLGQGALA